MPPSLLLDEREILRVLTCTGVCYAAFGGADGPYVLPLAFACTAEGGVVLQLREGGYAHALLTAQPRVCLAFSLLDEGSVDSVLLQGAASLGSACGGRVPVLVQPLQITGRRFALGGAQR